MALMATLTAASIDERRTRRTEGTAGRCWWSARPASSATGATRSAITRRGCGRPIHHGPDRDLGEALGEKAPADPGVRGDHLLRRAAPGRGRARRGALGARRLRRDPEPQEPGDPRLAGGRPGTGGDAARADRHADRELALRAQGAVRPGAARHPGLGPLVRGPVRRRRGAAGARAAGGAPAPDRSVRPAPDQGGGARRAAREDRGRAHRPALRGPGQALPGGGRGPGQGARPPDRRRRRAGALHPRLRPAQPAQADLRPPGAGARRGRPSRAGGRDRLRQVGPLPGAARPSASTPGSRWWSSASTWG